MLGFFRKTKGAVSIFLVIILLPTLTVAGLFVDISRIKLAQEITGTSADLALSTTLSYYDNSLKDYFGLLAECQDSEEAINLSKKYFAECMVSAGVQTTDAQTYANNLANSAGLGGDISDALQLSIDGDVNITPTANSELANPAVLKYEIVEFMKYRAPVNGAIDLINKLNKSDVEKNAKNASKEAEMTEAKENFYEAQEKLYDDAENAYNNIKKYTGKDGWNGLKMSDERYLTGMADFLRNPQGDGKSLKDLYKEAHLIIVKDLFSTHHKPDSSGNQDGHLQDTYLLKPKEIASTDADTYNSENKASESELNKALHEYNTAVNQFDKNKTNAKKTLDEDWGGPDGKSGFVNEYGTMEAKYGNYDIQYWWQLSKKFKTSYNNYVKAAEKVNEKYSVLKNAYDNADSKVSSTVKSNCSTALAEYNDTYKDLLDKDTPRFQGSSFGRITGILKQIVTQETLNRVSESRVFNIFGNHTEIGSEKTCVNGKIKLYWNDLNDLVGEKDGCLSKASEYLEDMREDLKDYVYWLNKWEEIANDPELEDSELAAEDRDEIEKVKEAGAPVSESDIDELQGRIDNIIELCTQLKKDLESIKYGGAFENGSPKSVSVTKLTQYSMVHHEGLFPISQIPVKTEALDKYAEDHFVFEIQPRIMNITFKSGKSSSFLSGSGENEKYVISDSYGFDITKPECKLLKWMKSEFDDNKKEKKPVHKDEVGTDVDDKSSAKKAKKGIKDKGDSTDSDKDTDDGKSHSFSEWKNWGEAELPSKSKFAPKDAGLGTKLSEAAKFTSSLFSDFSGTIGNTAVNSRDDLYMLEYVFDMFTYDTFDYEGCYNRIEDKSSVKVTNAKSKYKEVEEDWKNSNENKTLTLTPRNTEHNWAYGGEIEYILYGNKSNAVNKATAYGKIYLIRYALNLSPVKRTYWEDPALNALATALEAFAYIPASLTKTLAVLAITAAESGYDIAALKMGLPVVLCKEKDKIVCSYKSLFMGGDQNSFGDDDKKIKLQYSEYLKLFLFIKLWGSDENVVYTRTADVIQANMTLETDNKAYAMSKAYTHYDLTAVVLTGPQWTKLLSIYDMGDKITDKNWRSINVKMTRGY